MKKKARKSKKIFVVLLAVIILLLVILIASFMVLNHYTSKLNYQPVDNNIEEPVYTPEATKEPELSNQEKEEIYSIDEQLKKNLEAGLDREFDDKDVTNILLIGVDNDSNMEARGNADGLIILSINKETRQIVLTSLMRDIYVSVPDKYNTKLTMAYHYEGTEGLIDTVEANFGIPIDNYILVNYINVIDIVDAVGGVTLDVNQAEIYWMQEKIHNLNSLIGAGYTDNLLSVDQAGTIQMNGVQTAAYLRIRNTGNNDFGRTERARKVLLQIKNQVTGMGLKELNALANTVLPCITTDLTQGEILSLLLNSLDFMNYEFLSSRIPIDGYYYSADYYGAVIVPDYEVNREYLYQSIYEGTLKN